MAELPPTLPDAEAPKRGTGCIWSLVILVLIGESDNHPLPLPILANVPNAQDIDRPLLNLITHLVTTNEDPADIARLKFIKCFADSRLCRKSSRCRDQSSHHARGCFRIYFCEERMEP